MSSWYDLEVLMRQYYGDLLRDAEEERLARMVMLGQRQQPKSLLQALSQQISRVIIWGAQARKSLRLT